MARHVDTSSLGAHASAGDRPLESKDVTEQPLDNRVSVTSIMPLGAAICRGLKGISSKEKNKKQKQIKIENKQTTIRPKK